MSGVVALGYLLLGGLLVGVGALTLRYPEASYNVRTAWKHDDEVRLSEAGLADQRLLGVVLTFVGLVVAMIPFA